MQQILVVGAPNSGKITLVKELTGELPENIENLNPEYNENNENNSNELNKDLNSHSGLSLTWDLKTKYYEAEIGIWIDEYGSRINKNNILEDIKLWVQEFSSEAANQVLEVVGSFIFVFRYGTYSYKDIDLQMKILEPFIKKLKNINSNIVLIGAGFKPKEGFFKNDSDFGDFEGWDNLFYEYDFEYIDCSSNEERKELGEHTGILRLKDALQVYPWEHSNGKSNTKSDIDADNDIEDPTTLGYGRFSDSESENENEDEYSNNNKDDEIENEKRFDLEMNEFVSEIKKLNNDFSSDEETPSMGCEADVEKDLANLERLAQQMRLVRESDLPFEERKKKADIILKDLKKLI